jgi:peptidyl-prolyl cis-trans isomerase SurA
VQLKSKTQPHQANLTTDYQKIQDMALEKKKKEFMEGWVKTKIKSTYIKIDDSFRNCPFENSAWKNLQ